jgi:uncharacterized protein YPO0396
VRLADRFLAGFSTERVRLATQRQQLAGELETLRARETNLRIQIEGHGGGRLAEIEREVAQGEKERIARMARHQNFSELLRSRYVLGWSNERKIEALLAAARRRPPKPG